ncbi:RHS repeat-associated core domain-containing protein [Amycolatopsis sp. lyj-109]|uniref:RHS repeat-associated core domain-containing protein n=1 Tax=Amycolatopsis sp. lyj-109 TaxID=2789287 RepID=UPI0039794C03
MSNPLVAPTQDSTKAYSGVSLLESANDLKSAIESGDWASVALGAVGTALDALSMAMDPFGAILAAGVGWLIEHVGPLKEALNGLTGNADEIAAQSETWKNIATELGSVGEDLTGMVKADTVSWTGAAADTYRQRAQDTVTLLETAQKGCEGASSGVKTAGEVVAAVRALVRDIIAELVGHLISWALQVLFTLGIGMTWVVPQVITAVAKTASKIADLVKRLVTALKALVPLLKRAGDLFSDAAKALRKIKPGKSAPPPKHNDIKSGPKDIGGPNGKGGPDGPPPKTDPPPKGDSTTPSGAKGDDTTPSGAKGPDNPPKSDPPPASKGPDDSPKSPDTTPDGGSTTPSGAPKSPPKDGGGTPRGGPDPAKNKGPDEKVCEFDPIDVATGDVLLTEVDLVVPGELGELITRNHVSSYRDGRWFGRSWASLLDERLILTGGELRYHSADAMVLTFAVPLPGTAVTAQHGPPRRLHTDGDDYVVTDPGRGLARRFVPAPGVRDEWLLREVRADDGEFVQVQHDLTGAPSGLTHSAGARIAFETAAGRVRAVRAVAPAGDVLVARYDYDTEGHLARRANSTPRPALYDHDADGRITAWTDHNGAWYRYVYDDAGRCVRTVGDQGYLDGSLSYADGRTTTTDSLGHQKVFEFDAAGNVFAETDKLGGVTHSEWGPHNLLLARTDPLGRRTEFEHDTEGILRAVTRPDGTRAVLTERTESTLEIEVTDGGRTFRRRYAAPALPDPYTDPLGVADDEDAPAEDTPDASAADPDLFGRPRTIRKPGSRTTVSWTVEGDLQAAVAADGARQRWTYDGEGGETSHTDAINRVTGTERGPFGIVTAVTDPAGARTTRRSNPELRPVAVTNPAGQTWTFGYDAEGRLLTQTDFAGRVTQCGYDAAGQLIRLVNAAGETVEYHHDLLGNVIERVSAAGTDRYRYDPVGRLIAATGPDTAIELERDADGRVVRQTTAGRTTTFAYPDGSSAGRRTPSGLDVRWSRTEDRADILAAAGATLILHRDDAGRPVAIDAGSNRLLRQEFDSVGRLAVQHIPGGVRRYHRRPDGSVAAREDPVGGVRYDYDAVGRVTAAVTPTLAERYAYDVLGNLVDSSPGTGLEAGPRRYADTGLAAAGRVRYVHDAQGRLVRRTVAEPGSPELTWTFTWNAHDHLTGVRTPDGTSWRYRYDALDRRVAKQRLDAAGGVAEQVEFVWDGNTLIEALHTVGGVAVETLTWIHHPDGGRPVAQAVTSPDGTTRLSAFVTDDVGTPLELVGVDDGVVQPVRLSLWGLTPPGGTATPLRFPGQYHDRETGLYYNVFRYYDPANARYISPDPLGLEPAPNPMTYVGDPLLQADPLGLTAGGGFGDDPGDQRRFSGRKLAGKCKAALQSAVKPFSPYPKTKPKKGTASGNTSSSTPSSSAPPRGPKDPASGRTTSQGGGTTSGPQTLDGSPRPGGSKPQPGELTDVKNLEDTPHANYSNELKNELANVKGYDPNGSNRWIRGHLQNDNLGGPGVSENMTPLTSTANKNMSGTFEGPLKNANVRLEQLKANMPNDAALNRAGFDPSQYNKVRQDIQNLHVEYSVDASPNVKFPNSPNPFERSIRDHVVLNAEYKGLTPELQQYIGFAKEKNFLPRFPPVGTKMDTLTGAMS